MLGSQTWIEAYGDEYADFLHDMQAGVAGFEFVDEPAQGDGEGDIDTDAGYDPYAGGPEMDEAIDPCEYLEYVMDD